MPVSWIRSSPPPRWWCTTRAPATSRRHERGRKPALGARERPRAPRRATLTCKEALIARAYDRRIDHAFGEHRGRSRLVSAAILLLGIVALLAVYLSQERGRTARAARVVRVGDDSASVLAGLGAPALRCPPGSLAHLRESLPAGTPRVVADETIDRLRRETATRWLWGNDPACSPRPGHTEVGLDRAGRVLWTVPEHGDSPATLD